MTLLKLYDTLSRTRDFALSDALRAELFAKGVVLEDSPGGSTWRRG